MQTTEDRFWAKVKKTGTCWEWQASLTSTGYGQFRFSGRPQGAHRYSWELAHGSIPDRMFVLHKCDNPLCVRPDHLFLGDPRANSIDMHSKGRWHYVPAGQGKKRPEPTGRKRVRMPLPPAERFWPKVNTHDGDAEVCWEFEGSTDSFGYGLFYMPDLGRKVVAHRVAYALHYGEFDRSLVVMHTCDNPPCVNPLHLRLGTRADNNRDRARKGRGREARQWGAANPRARLTQADVDEMRALAESGVTQVILAERFGVNQPQVSRILRGVSWPTTR